MSQYTKEAMKDNRYKVNQFRSNIKIHPRDWAQMFGDEKPLQIVNRKNFGPTVRENLIPIYTPSSGWEWAKEGTHKHIRNKYE